MLLEVDQRFIYFAGLSVADTDILIRRALARDIA
jgi:hypothetical protein